MAVEAAVPRKRRTRTECRCILRAKLPLLLPLLSPRSNNSISIFFWLVYWFCSMEMVGHRSIPKMWFWAWNRSTLRLNWSLGYYKHLKYTLLENCKARLFKLFVRSCVCCWLYWSLHAQEDTAWHYVEVHEHRNLSTFSRISISYWCFAVYILKSYSAHPFS